jgi:hypothetical protein
MHSIFSVLIEFLRISFKASYPGPRCEITVTNGLIPENGVGESQKSGLPVFATITDLSLQVNFSYLVGENHLKSFLMQRLNCFGPLYLATSICMTNTEFMKSRTTRNNTTYSSSLVISRACPVYLTTVKESNGRFVNILNNNRDPLY